MYILSYNHLQLIRERIENFESATPCHTAPRALGKEKDMKELRIFISDTMEPSMLMQVPDSVENILAVYYCEKSGKRYEENITLNDNLTIDWKDHWDHLEVIICRT